MIHSLYTPLPISPGSIIEVCSFSTDDVQTPTGRKVLQFIILTARLCLLSALLLHGNQTCTHTITIKTTQRAPTQQPHFSLRFKQDVLLFQNKHGIFQSQKIYSRMHTKPYRVHPGNNRCQRHWTASPQSLHPSVQEVCSRKGNNLSLNSDIRISLFTINHCTKIL